MKRVLLLALVQVGAILGWAADEEATRRAAPTFRVPMQALTATPDGRQHRLQAADLAIEVGAADALLSAAEIERFLGGAREFHGPALLGFCPTSGSSAGRSPSPVPSGLRPPMGPVMRVCALSRRGDTPANRSAQAQFWSRARVAVLAQDGWRVRADFVATRAFLPPRLALPAPESAPGWTLELAHREGRPPLPLRLRFEDRVVFES